MATYVVNINERTNIGKSLLGYLRNLGVIVEDETPKFNATTQKAFEELKQGKVTRYKSFNDLLKEVKK